jgi:parallel beta-helix repeat protein
MAATWVGVPASGAELWVDRQSIGGPCSDHRPRARVTSASPWCTLVPAVAAVEAGDVVIVREGEYTEACGQKAVLQTSRSGTVEKPIRFVAYSNDTVTLSGNGPADRGIQFAVWDDAAEGPAYIEVSGFIVRDFRETGVNIVRSSNIVIRDVEVTNCRLGAVGARRSSSITIEGCDIHHNPMAGWTSAVSLHENRGRNVVRGNRIWANTDEDYRETEGHGIILDHCQASASTLIENNLVWNNEGWCINLFHSPGANVRNNTCFGNGLDRATAGELNVRAAHSNICNNILVSRGSAPAIKLHADSRPSTITSDFNVFWFVSDRSARLKMRRSRLIEVPRRLSRQWEAHSLITDPMLTDPENHEFKLAAASPAIDSGNNQNAAEHDIVGTERPIDGDRDGHVQVDCGAYEFSP